MSPSVAEVCVISAEVLGSHDGQCADVWTFGACGDAVRPASLVRFALITARRRQDAADAATQPRIPLKLLSTSWSYGGEVHSLSVIWWPWIPAQNCHCCMLP